MVGPSEEAKASASAPPPVPPVTTSESTASKVDAVSTCPGASVTDARFTSELPGVRAGGRVAATSNVAVEPLARVTPVQSACPAPRSVKLASGSELLPPRAPTSVEKRSVTVASVTADGPLSVNVIVYVSALSGVTASAPSLTAMLSAAAGTTPTPAAAVAGCGAWSLVTEAVAVSDSVAGGASTVSVNARVAVSPPANDPTNHESVPAAAVAVPCEAATVAGCSVKADDGITGTITLVCSLVEVLVTATS